MATNIYSGFPGVGKSRFFRFVIENNLKTMTGDCICADSDSSQFSFLPNGERNPNFVEDYIAHIKSQIGVREFLFISSHKEIRDALVNNGIKFNLVYPSRQDKDEYIRRYIERGSPDSFINLITENWDNWICELENFDKEGIATTHIQLERGAYLSDMLL